MSNAEHAMTLLGELAEADRRWILDRLPVTARSRLADHVNESRYEASIVSQPARVPVVEPVFAAASRVDFEWDSAVAQLRAANPDSVVEALRSEPAWLVNALLRAAEWPWARAVCKGLPARIRAELVTIGRDGSRLAGPATRTLVRELAKRSVDWPPAAPRPSRLRTIAQRLRHGARS